MNRARYGAWAASAACSIRSKGKLRVMKLKGRWSFNADHESTEWHATMRSPLVTVGPARRLCRVWGEAWKRQAVCSLLQARCKLIGCASALSRHARMRGGANRQNFIFRRDSSLLPLTKIRSGSGSKPTYLLLHKSFCVVRKAVPKTRLTSVYTRQCYPKFVALSNPVSRCLVFRLSDTREGSWKFSTSCVCPTSTTTTRSVIQRRLSNASSQCE